MRRTGLAPRVLVTDPIHPSGLEALREAGVQVDYRPGISHGELVASVGRYDALVVRGRTRVDGAVIEAGRGRLKAICRAGVGLDNIDLEAARSAGVEVFNTPEAPTEAVAELAVAL
ncbi:3-phosphoglycerate dehydrogenase, partial [Candidatus Bathyarchaeota archaeon]